MKILFIAIVLIVFFLILVYSLYKIAGDQEEALNKVSKSKKKIKKTKN